MTNSKLLEEGLAALARGWKVIRLAGPEDQGPAPGKRPMDPDWPNGPLPTPSDVEAWVSAGCNLGVVTGRGFVVVDIDQEELPRWLPPTLMARTGSGKWHAYYAGEAKNSGGKFLPETAVKGQVRGAGGQVVLAGSIHADTGQPYEWVNQIPMVPYTAYLAARPAALDWSEAPSRRYFEKAMEAELGRVMLAPEGARNNTLFAAAANLAELSNSGGLDLSESMNLLANAANRTGLDRREVENTIRSAMKKVGGKARGPNVGNQVGYGAGSGVPDSAPHFLTDSLIPGPHTTDQGEYIEATPESFSRSALDAQPPMTLFVRGKVPGIIQGGEFRPISNDEMRIYSKARPVKWIRVKDESSADGFSHRQSFVPLSRELAGLMLARATDHPNVLPITAVSFIPQYLSPTVITKEGWNEGGIWLAGTPLAVDPVDPKKLFDDILCDFPFQEEADRQNFISGIVTLFVYHWINGNVPLFFVSSTIERTGKTMLVDEVLGEIILGRPTPAMQFSGSDEEKDKRILAVLMRGLQLLHIDNLTHWIDSPALASLLTARTYTGRMLGQTLMIEVENRTCIWATGNNVNSTGEIAKRSIPVRLLPPDSEPHMRTGFRHPNLRAYVASKRAVIIATVLKMIQDWIDAGQPGHDVTIGGFAEWSRIVGGIMRHAGFDQWMKNYRSWTNTTDVEGSDFETFIAHWKTHGCGDKKPSELCEMAQELGLFERTLGKSANDRSATQAFTKGVLRKHLNQVRFGVKLIERKTREGRRYGLEAKDGLFSDPG